MTIQEPVSYTHLDVYKRQDFTYWERDAAEENKAAAAGWPCDSWRYVVEDVKSKATRTAKYLSLIHIYGELGTSQSRRIYSTDGKSVSLQARPNGGGADGAATGLPP